MRVHAFIYFFSSLNRDFVQILQTSLQQGKTVRELQTREAEEIFSADSRAQGDVCLAASRALEVRGEGGRGVRYKLR